MAKRNKPKEPVDVLFLRGIPKSLKCMFKAACSRRGTTMKSVLLRHMRNYSEEEIEASGGRH